jgi:hypothetical protein
MISTNSIKHLVFLFLLFIVITTVRTQNYDPQVSTINLGNGDVRYPTSNCDSNDLRFFIFGDGFYSFENHPTHHYPPSSPGYTAKVWFAQAYDPDPPKLRNAPSSGTTQSGPNTNPEIYMPTNPMIAKSWSLVQNKKHYYMLVFRNNTYSTTSGCLEFYYKSTELLLDTAILQYNGWVYNRTYPVSNQPNFNKMVKWSFSGLAPGETRIVYVPMKVLQPQDAIVTTASRVRIGCTGNVPLVVQQNDVRATPHDPNYKSADRYYSGSSWPFVPLHFKYKINFQNIGTGYATNVVVTDQFSDDLDINTLQLINSEHPFTKSVNGNQLTLTFPNINLPGTKQTVPYIFEDSQTESWIEFSICTKNGLLQQKIKNEATVYFDNLPGMTTNTATINLDLGGPIVNCGSASPRPPGSAEAQDITLSPNPVNDLVTLHAYSKSPTVINIYNTNGVLMKQVRYNNLPGETQVDMNDLPAGLYLMKVKSAKINVSLKVIKQ